MEHEAVEMLYCREPLVRQEGDAFDHVKSHPSVGLFGCEFALSSVQLSYAGLILWADDKLLWLVAAVC